MSKTQNKIVFLQSEPPRFEQYKNQGNAGNLVQSPLASKWLESAIAPLVPRGFYPTYRGQNDHPRCSSKIEYFFSSSANPRLAFLTSTKKATHTPHCCHAHATQRHTEYGSQAFVATATFGTQNVQRYFCNEHLGRRGPILFCIWDGDGRPQVACNPKADHLSAKYVASCNIWQFC